MGTIVCSALLCAPRLQSCAIQIYGRMDFLLSIKKFLPTVSAFERETTVREDVTDQKGSEEDNVSSEDEEIAVPEQNVDIRTKPDSYTDVLLEGVDNSDIFVERRGNRYKPSWTRTLLMLERGENIDRFQCEKTLYSIMKEEPLVKLMIGALNSSGCNIDIRRNFSCEVCCKGVYGGYDVESQQVVLCQNNLREKSKMATVLTHELIHMFDHCVNKTDFKLPEHLACTEIRAINLTSCSLTDSFFSGFVSTMELATKQYHKKHALCVKDRALKSVLAASTLSEEVAREVIDRVFPYCYEDLEPVGRRMKNKSNDNQRAYFDAQHYGYV